MGNKGERLNVAASAARAAAVSSLGAMPLVVLSHAADRGGQGLPGDLDACLGQLWLEMQTEQSRLSTNGSLIVAQKSMHAIHVEEPQLVVDAIVQVVHEARRTR
jgi:hypothetical protein